MRIPWYRCMAHSRTGLGCGYRPLLVRTVALERCTLTGAREGGRAAGSRNTEVGFGAFGSILHLLLLHLPDPGALADICLRGTRCWLAWLWRDRPWSTDRVDCRARGRRHADAVRVVLKPAFNPIAWRQEGVKALDQVRVAGEQLGNSTNDSGGINAIEVSDSTMTTILPGAAYVWLLKSFMMSRNLLYTSGCSWNCTLTWSR